MAEFTKEQRDILIKTAEYMVKRENTSEYSENIRKVAEIALAALTASMEQEPVAWRWFHLKQWHVTNDEARARNLAWDGVNVTPLYAAPQLPQPAVVIEGLYKIANHIASCKGGMPEEWQDWAEEIESDIRRISLQPVPDKMAAIVKDEHDYVEGWNACRAAMLQGDEPVHDVDNTNRQFESLGCAEDTARRFKCTGLIVTSDERKMQMPAAPQQEIN